MIALGKCPKDHQKKDTGKTEHWVYRMEKVTQAEGTAGFQKVEKAQRQTEDTEGMEEQGVMVTTGSRRAVLGHIFNTPAMSARSTVYNS